MSDPSRPPPSIKGLGPNGRSRDYTYLDRATRTLVVRFHQYEKSDGTLRSGDRPDPKALLHDGVEYHLIQARTAAGRLLQQPQLRYGRGWQRWSYVLFRRAKCHLLGR